MGSHVYLSAYICIGACTCVEARISTTGISLQKAFTLVFETELALESVVHLLN